MSPPPGVWIVWVVGLSISGGIAVLLLLFNITQNCFVHNKHYCEGYNNSCLNNCLNKCPRRGSSAAKVKSAARDGDGSKPLIHQGLTTSATMRVTVHRPPPQQQPPPNNQSNNIALQNRMLPIRG